MYGTITLGALLAAEDGLHDTYVETVGSVVLALLLYWLAHSYAELLGDPPRDRGQSDRARVGAGARARLGDRARHRGAAARAGARVGAGADQQTGVSVALWTCAASLVALELLAGLRARARPGELALEVCVGAAMGLAVIALRAILH